jgi:hypothetical protein
MALLIIWDYFILFYYNFPFHSIIIVKALMEIRYENGNRVLRIRYLFTK